MTVICGPRSQNICLGAPMAHSHASLQDPPGRANISSGKHIDSRQRRVHCALTRSVVVIVTGGSPSPTRVY
uniref:Uncharacterized protein n=1 Tax=Rhizophora mucronata TaxID=61149 RepID=A0A2P2PPR5_RHIMU